MELVKPVRLPSTIQQSYIERKIGVGRQSVSDAVERAGKGG